MTTPRCDTCAERVAIWLDAEGNKLCSRCGVRLIERLDWWDYLAYPLRSVDGERWFRPYNPTHSRR